MSSPFGFGIEVFWTKLPFFYRLKMYCEQVRGGKYGDASESVSTSAARWRAADDVDARER